MLTEKLRCAILCSQGKQSLVTEKQASLIPVRDAPGNAQGASGTGAVIAGHIEQMHDRGTGWGTGWIEVIDFGFLIEIGGIVPVLLCKGFAEDGEPVRGEKDF